MTSYLTLTLDTAPPASPQMLIGSGALVTGEQVVLVSISTADYTSGARDVAEMKIWGDVEPSADPLVQPTEDASSWIGYAASYTVVLATGSGAKTLYARLRDDVHNETLPFQASVLLDLSTPVVSISRGVERGRISKQAPYDLVTFTWQANYDYDAFEVRVVPNPGSAHNAGIVLPTANGSEGVTGGPGLAATDTLVTIRGADLELASPGDAAKYVKVFVRTPDGAWSA